MILGEEGGVTRGHDGNDYLPWTYLDDFNVYYGKMYAVMFRDDLPPNTPIALQWNNYRSDEERQYSFYKPYPQYFSFIDKPNYQSFIIEEIENDEGLQEIGVYAGDECVGAAVFQGRYPFHLMAYTDETHAGKEISFVLHRGTRDGDEKIRMVEARNKVGSEYSRQTLKSTAAADRQ
jgi:hypothetical protein